MSEAESFGENRNSFVFPLTKMRRKLIISAGTLLDILPLDKQPDVHEKKKKKRKRKRKKPTQQTERCRGLQATEISVNDLDEFVMCFPKTKWCGIQVAAWPRLCAEERSREPSGRSAGHSGGSSPVVVVSSGPRTGRARWTEPSDTRAWSGGRGLNAPSSFVGRQWFTRAPESSPHEAAKCPGGRYTDNYAATHGRVSAEWPAGETAYRAPPGPGAGPPEAALKGI